MATEDYNARDHAAVFRSHDEMQNLYFALFDAILRAKGLGELDAKADLDVLLGEGKDEVLALLQSLMQTWGTLAEKGQLDQEDQKAVERTDVEAGFGALSLRPFVNVKADGQFRPEHARQLAFQIMDAATVAEDDGMMLLFVRDKLGVKTEAEQAQLMNDMREFRTEFRRRDAEDPEQMPEVLEMRSAAVRAIHQRRGQ